MKLETANIDHPAGRRITGSVRPRRRPLIPKSEQRRSKEQNGCREQPAEQPNSNPSFLNLQRRGRCQSTCIRAGVPGFLLLAVIAAIEGRIGVSVAIADRNRHGRRKNARAALADGHGRSGDATA